MRESLFGTEKNCDEVLLVWCTLRISTHWTAALAVSEELEGDALQIGQRLQILPKTQEVLLEPKGGFVGSYGPQCFDKSQRFAAQLRVCRR